MIRSLSLAAIVAVLSPSALAACPSGEPVLDVLTCSSSITGRVSYTETSDLGGTCGGTNPVCYSCGDPSSPLSQGEAEDVYEFTCQVSGDVTLEITGLDCDVDIYVLDDTCDPYDGCVAGSTFTSTTTDSVDFTCTAGTTYYVVIEGYGFSLNPSNAAACSGATEGDYTLSFDVTAGTGCNEDCDDGIDNDFDSTTDCDDTDCASDPVCACDEDGDGYDMIPCGGTDCDDSDYYVNTGATEYCDGEDNDCDGTTDEAAAADASTYYRDADGDNFGTSATTARGCSAPTGYVSNASDCNDNNSAVNPLATETCDSIDNDCDGATDETGGTTWYRDADGDSYGTSATTTVSCSAPTGYVSNANDCDDTSAAVSPADFETCNLIDDDCDGSIDESGGTTWYADTDSDGYGDASSTRTACTQPSGYVSTSGDCNDRSSSVHPTATEYCNDIDDDCDGTTDEAGSADESTWYDDDDGDGYGDSATGTDACDAPTGYVSASGDCDDANSAVYPGASEICDGTDNDCDGRIDESGGSTWYADSDGDGYGDPSVASVSCTAPSGYVTSRTDCDDTDAAVNPGATEYCNGVDDDCDGTVDEDDAYDVTTWFADSDADGYGDVAVTEVSCSIPAGYVENDDDCWDDDASVRPGGTETCDGVDEDCDGTVDEGTSCYDDDGDGYSEAGGDCDDARSDAAPAESETCNGADDDCDGIVDETTECYDDDADGWTEEDGDCNDGDSAVSPGTPEFADNGVDDDCDGAVDDGIYDPDSDGYTVDGGDCGEENASVFPGAVEVEDGLDNDCDGIIDEGTDAYDDDGDGETENDGDCNDADADINTSTEEVDNGVDDDCDGNVDQGGDFTDDDGDGYSDAAGDCDDADGAVSPDAQESPNGIDDDCDDEIDEGQDDVDGDGYTSEDGDCDDLEGWSNPGAAEECDGLDNNCDGQVDEACEPSGTKETGTCGCGSSGAAWALFPLVLSFGATLLRRRIA